MVFIRLHFTDVPFVEPVQVIVACHTARLQLSHGCEGLAHIVNGGASAFDISSNVVWRTADQLGLVGQPVHMRTLRTRLALS